MPKTDPDAATSGTAYTITISDAAWAEVYGVVAQMPKALEQMVTTVCSCVENVARIESEGRIEIVKLRMELAKLQVKAGQTPSDTDDFD